MNFLLKIFFLFIIFSSFCYSNSIDYLLVDKSDRELNLIRNKKIIKKFKISLGFEPIGKKIKQGDGKTPEGLYFIDKKIRNSSYFLALQISYPNPWDTRQALANGYHPGGQIMIHGLPNKNYDDSFHNKKNDWTEGCIAVSNEEMQYLWKIVTVDTPILIVR